MFGIVMGTLSVHRYREMLNRLSFLAEQHEQVAYPFMVGKLTLPKLANFSGMEGFVLIGCERSCFIDTHVMQMLLLLFRNTRSLSLCLTNMRFLSVRERGSRCTFTITRTFGIEL